MELAMGDTGEPGRTEHLEKCRIALLRENETIEHLLENAIKFSERREDYGQ